MIGRVKSILLHTLMGATATITALTVLVAYSDRLDPVAHPLLACAGMLFPFFLVATMALLVLWLLLSWRRAWVPLAGLALAYPATRTYIPLHFTAQPPEGSIKVVSYNVACYTITQKYPQAQDVIHDYLKELDADIVCLQEDVPQGTTQHPKDYSDLYAHNDTLHVNKPTSPLINALGIHTRYPILKKERIAYTSEANGSAAFFLLIGHDTVVVVNNHLESTHLSTADRQRYQDMLQGGMTRDSAQAETRFLVQKLSQAMVTRARQADAVHRYIEEHSQYPIIVCGDFNDSPISYARRTVAQGLTDCYVEAGSGLGISFNQKGFYFRIDQLMCSHHFTPYHCYVDNRIDASDHYPVVGWLKR